MDRYEGGQYIISTLVSAERMCRLSMDGFASISLQPKGAALSVFLKRDLCMFWPRWVFFAARRLSLVAASEGGSLVAVCRLPLATASVTPDHGPRASGLQ